MFNNFRSFLYHYLILLLGLSPLIVMIPVPERFQREFHVMFKAATEAGLVCRKLSEKLKEMGVMTKSDHSPVTCK